MAAPLRAIRPSSLLSRPIARAAAPRQTQNVAPRRFYSEAPKPTEGPAKSGEVPPLPESRTGGTRTMLLFSVAGIATATAAFLLLNREDKKAVVGVGKDGAHKLKGSKHKTEAGFILGDKSDYQAVYNAIAEKLEKDPSYDDGSYGPVLVRLAWHASGTYDKESGSGGSNGATMRFAPESDHGANAGLLAARDFMEEIKEDFPWITYSDLWTLGGVAAVQELGGPKIPWRPGRSDREAEHCTPDGRLPDGDKEQDHLRQIFYRMGFNDQEIVALSGAHALGRCHPDRSGFSGPWQHSPTSFNNEYYNLLFNEKWDFKKWNGPKQYVDRSTGGLMMLTTDMALIKDKSFRKHAERYAKDEDVFFKEFSDVFAKLLELGVPFREATNVKFTLNTTAEQENSK
ncbi:unnamed protein product [Sympodiomycopsis kandeliae]